MMLSNPNLNIFVVKVIIECLKKYYVCKKKQENNRSPGKDGLHGQSTNVGTQQRLCACRKYLGATHGKELGPNPGHKWKSC